EHLPALDGGTRVVSIAARGDLVVPPPRTALRGATNVLVPVEGVDAHDALPAYEAAEREMALALVGLPPGCETWGDIAADIVVGETVDTVESTLAGLTG